MAVPRRATTRFQQDVGAQTTLDEFSTAILNSVSAHVAVLDESGVIVAVNQAWRKFAADNGLADTHLDPHAGIGANYLEACQEATGEEAATASATFSGIRQVLDGSAEDFSLEYPCNSPGRERWFAVNITPLVTGDFRGAVVLRTDISDRKLIERKQQEGAQRLAAGQLIVKRVNEICARCTNSEDLDPTLQDILSLAMEIARANMGTLLLVDAATGELSLKAQAGFDPAFALSEYWVSLDRLDSACSRAVHTKQPVVVSDVSEYYAESPLLDRLQRMGSRSLIATPIVSRGCRVIGAFVTHYHQPTHPSDAIIRQLEFLAQQAANLIERTQSEYALHHSEQRFARFMEQIPGPAWIKTYAGRYIEVNDAAAKFLGKPRVEVFNHFDHELLDPQHASLFRESDRQVMESGESAQFLETVQGPDGICRHLLINKFPVPNSNGGPLLVGGVAIDVTDRKEAEETIRQIIEAISPTTGQDLFRTLAVHLTRICQVDYAFVAQTAGEDRTSAAIIAASHSSELIDNFSYGIAESPFAGLCDNSFFHVPDSVRQRFPHDNLLSDLHIDSCMGIALMATDGSPIGFIALMHRRPFARAERAETIMRIVASRAAAELEREHAESALRANEIRLQTVLDHATDALLLHDAETRVIDANHQACESLGYSKEELIGMMPSEFDPNASLGLSAWVIQKLKAGEMVTFDSRHRRKSGAEFHVEVRIRPFWIDGKRYGISLARDITERKQAEEALRSAQRRLASILEHANVGLWDWDLSANEIAFSREWKSQLGYRDDEFENRFEVWQTHVHPADREPALGRVTEAIGRGGGEFEAEVRMRHKNGAWRWILSRGSVIPNPAGKPVQVVGIHLDITERKWAEAALRSQLRVLERIATGDPLADVLEEIVRLVEGQIPDSMCSILLLNEDGTRLHSGAGKSLPERFITAIDGILIGPEVGSCGTAAYLKKTIAVSDIANDPLWKEYRELGLSFGLRSCWSAPIFAGEGASYGECGGRVLGTFALYGREISSPTDADKRVVSAAAQLAGIAIERHESEATIHDSEDRLRTLLENLQNVAVQAYETDGTITLWNKASERVYGYSAREALGKDIVSLLHSEATGAAERQFMADALRDGKSPEPEELEIQRSDGVTITVLSNQVVHRRSGRPPEFFCFDVDVTDKKRAEVELALRQAELVHASRLSTLGQMVAALSHEVAQPLTAIGNYATASDHQLNNGPPESFEKLQGYIQNIALQTQRCTAILQRLRDFSRRGKPLRSSCDLRQLIEDSIDLVANDLRRQNVKIRQEVKEPLPLIVADRVQLQQVIVNLLTNACDAVRDQPDERRLIKVCAHADDECLELAVEDRGAGFEADAASRLFEPFFTTKSEGLGIGLNVCESIVRNHRGQIQASINNQGGATFIVRLPMSEETQECMSKT